MSVSFAEASQLAVNAWAATDMVEWGPLVVDGGLENVDYFHILWSIVGCETGIEGAPSIFVDKTTGDVVFIWVADPATKPRYRQMIRGMARIPTVKAS